MPEYKFRNNGNDTKWCTSTWDALVESFGSSKADEILPDSYMEPWWMTQEDDEYMEECTFTDSNGETLGFFFRR